MSDELKSRVSMVEGNDPDLEVAATRARATFRYFWRELTWEARRIVPGLNLACVKVPFSDETPDPTSDHPSVEQMWVSDVHFDGQSISGTLINQPNWLRSVKEGDTVKVTIDEISDWMYAIGGRVYGAFSVNVIRSQMSKGERKQHDDAWGLDFGDPDNVHVLPSKEDAKAKVSFLGRLLGKSPKPAPAPEPDPNIDHPMSINMAPKLSELLEGTPNAATDVDDDGWTMLHSMALGGSLTSIPILLQAGADPNVLTNHGMSAIALAESLQWDRVVELLRA